MCVHCESHVLLFSMPSCCQRTERTFKSYKKLDERNGRTGTGLPDSTVSPPQFAWVAPSMVDVYLRAPHCHGDDAPNYKQQPLTCPPSASRCQVRLASWNRPQRTPASYLWWGHRPCCFPIPALSKKHLLPLGFCFSRVMCSRSSIYFHLFQANRVIYTPTKDFLSCLLKVKWLVICMWAQQKTVCHFTIIACVQTVYIFWPRAFGCCKLQAELHLP